MKKFLSVFLLVSYTLNGNLLFAESSGFLQLRAVNSHTSNSKFTITPLTSHKTSVLFSTQTNSKHSEESQKFEFFGNNPNNMAFKIKKISNDNNLTIYQIIITQKSQKQLEDQQVFLKISAN